MEINRIEPVTGANFPDLEELFGSRGACGGCWCMYWRVLRTDYHPGATNRNALYRLAEAGQPIGLLAYGAETAVGWCSVGPRESYRRLATAVVGRDGTNEPDRWTVPCFFVRPGHRRLGVAATLLAAACDFSRDNGARLLEGYPTTSAKAAASDLYVGTRGMFERQGFHTVRQPTPTRLVMELSLK